MSYPTSLIPTTSYGLDTIQTYDGGLVGGAPIGVTTSSSSDLLSSTGLISLGLDTILGELDLSRNLDLVSEYGLNSWGASTSPDESQKKFDTEVIPYVEAILKGVTPDNLEMSLNEIEKYLTFLIMLETHKLKYHTRADSTRAGRQEIIKLATALRENTVRKTIATLKAKGVKITSNTKFEANAQITYNWSPTDNSFHSDNGYNYLVYYIDSSDLNNVLSVNGQGQLSLDGSATASMWWVIPLFVLGFVTWLFTAFKFKKGKIVKKKKKKNNN